MVKKSTKIKSADLKKSMNTLKKQSKPKKVKPLKEEVVIKVLDESDPPIKKEVVKKKTTKDIFNKV